MVYWLYVIAWSYNIYIYLFIHLSIYLASHLTLTNKNTRRRPAFFVELLELSASSGDGKRANPFGATKPLRTKGPFPSRLRASDRISGEFMMIPFRNVPLVGKTTQKWYHLISSRAFWINIGLSAVYLHCKYIYILGRFIATSSNPYLCSLMFPYPRLVGSHFSSLGAHISCYQTYSKINQRLSFPEVWDLILIKHYAISN